MIYTDWLIHFGVKGQKWGVRRYQNYDGTLTEAGKDRYNSNEGTEHERTNKLVLNALQEGIIKLDVKEKEQSAHFINSPQYIKGKSYIEGDLNLAESMIKELYATGDEVYDKNGDWIKRELVDTDKVLGYYVDVKGNTVPTHTFTIIYSKDGTHIYPQIRSDKKK